ncbi:hypothetical protein [Staphylococcus phage PT1-4]
MDIREKESLTNDLLDSIILRGTEDIDFHMSPTDKYSLDVSELNDEPIVGRAARLLYKNLLDSTKKVAIVVDMDMDGFTSSALFVKFMQYINHPIGVLMDEGKTHGLTDSIMDDVIGNYDLVIIPDAGSNDIKQHQRLLDNGIDFIILDHHEVLPESIEHLNTTENGVVVNNQLLDMNKNYTGVGMVYIFLKYVNFLENLDLDIDKYLDLVALGQVADVSNVADKEIRYYVTKGLNNINNLFIKSVMERKGLQEMTGRDASFSIISMINAVTRIGSLEDKRELFDALVSESLETTTVEVRKKNKSTGKFDKIPTELTIHDITVKACESIKTKQDKIVKEFLDKVEILYDGNVLIGLLEEEAPSSITGLIAMKLSDKKQKPVMIGKEYNDSLAGSLRAPDGLDFKRILTISRLFNFVSGHASAAGWGINRFLLDELIEYLEEYSFTNETSYLVDKLYNKPDSSDIYTIEMHKHVFGGAVVYPLFGYEGITFNIKCINVRGSVTTFFDNGVSFVLFNSPDNIKEDIDSYLDSKSNVTMNIVGEPRINKFGNKEISQIIIKDYEFLEKYDIVDEEPVNDWGIDF